MWEAGDLDSAAGIYLDRLAAFVNVSRQKAVNTMVYTALWGAKGAVVPKGHLTRLASGERFRLAGAVAIGTDALLGFSFKVVEVLVGAAYSFQLDTAILSYTAVDGDTQESIQTALCSHIDDTRLHIEDKGAAGVTIRSIEGIVPFALSFGDPKMELLSLGAFGVYEAETPGPLFAPAGALTKILANVPGLDGVVNYASGITGRAAESDAELRVNLESRQKQAGGNETAIENELRKLAGVGYAKVYSNRAIVEYQGRPPKSYEAIVIGGIDHEIARTIFAVGPAGIRAFGNTVMTILDDEGFPWEIGFSRPTNRYIWVKIGVSRTNEEPFPVSAAEQIKENIEAWGAKNQSVGADFIRQRINVPLFQAPGIAYADIRAAVTSDLTPPDESEYAENNIPIGEREIALIDRSRIEVREL